jgi:lysyl-tRNA synthetase class 1
MTDTFWAEEAADAVEANDRPPVVKGGVSPSGIPHIGNFNEVLRGHFVTEVLRDRGHDARQVFTRDDRDPLRRVPDTVADADGAVVALDDAAPDARPTLEDHLGRPYVDVPDPFGCHDSWADHFGGLLEQSTEDLGVPVDYRSNDAMYRDGDFLPPTRTILSVVDAARDLLADFQRTVDDDYVPFMPICEDCGRITATATAVDLTDETVSYRCDAADLGGVTVEGCGHEGTADLTEGKLPWRFEWPAQWSILDVGFEPFGKDHAEGSWPSGQRIARELLDHEPPESLVYEFFLVDGEKMSASAGNVYTVTEILEMVEPEVLEYFFAKNPRKQRDFALHDLDQLVDRFDRVEAIHFEDEEPADDRERLEAETVYPHLVDEIRPRVRVPYTFAAMVGVADDRDARLDALRRSGHLPEDATDAQVDDALRRVRLARSWARRMDNEYHVAVAEERPEVSFDAATRAGLHDLADVVADGATAEEIQDAVFETAREHDVDVGAFFAAGYELFLGEDSGPKLGPLLAALDRAFVVERLRSA